MSQLERCVPKGYLVINPHGIVMRIIDSTSKTVRFRVEDALERHVWVYVDEHAKSAEFRLTLERRKA